MTTNRSRRALILAAVFAAMSGAATRLFAGHYSWTTTGPEPGQVFQILSYASNPNRLYVVDSYFGGYLFRSDDRGQSWCYLEAYVPGYVVADPTNPDVLYAPSVSGVIKTTDGGVSWSARERRSACGLLELIGGRAFRHIGSLCLRRSRGQRACRAVPLGRRRATWNAVPSNEPQPYWQLTVDAFDANTLYAIAGDAYWKSADGGSTWRSHRRRAPAIHTTDLQRSESARDAVGANLERRALPQHRRQHVVCSVRDRPRGPAGARPGVRPGRPSDRLRREPGYDRPRRLRRPLRVARLGSELGSARHRHFGRACGDRGGRGSGRVDARVRRRRDGSARRIPEERRRRWHLDAVREGAFRLLRVRRRRASRACPNAAFTFSGANFFGTLDAGANWAPLPSPGFTVFSLVFDPTNASVLYGQYNGWIDPTSYGGVYKSTDGGGTWADASAGLTPQPHGGSRSACPDTVDASREQRRRDLQDVRCRRFLAERAPGLRTCGGCRSGRRADPLCEPLLCSRSRIRSSVRRTVAGHGSHPPGCLSTRRPSMSRSRRTMRRPCTPSRAALSTRARTTGSASLRPRTAFPSSRWTSTGWLSIPRRPRPSMRAGVSGGWSCARPTAPATGGSSGKRFPRSPRSTSRCSATGRDLYAATAAGLFQFHRGFTDVPDADGFWDSSTPRR